MTATPALSIFCVPKPFVGHIGMIQRNALASWTRLVPRPEIFVLGDEEGAAEAAASLGIEHLAALRRNQRGTPLVDDVIARTQALGHGRLLAYVNADIVLMSDFGAAVRRVADCRRSRLLMVGRRCDVDLVEPIDFEGDWESSLRAMATARGTLRGPSWIDYFVFRPGLWPEVPPFALGRTTWDNWLLYEARRRGAALIDATPVVQAIHQNHPYTGFAGESDLWASDEARHNRELAGGFGRFMSIRNANWVLTAKRLKPAYHNHPVRLYDGLLRFYLRAKTRFASQGL